MENRGPNLTAKQIEVLSYMADGNSNKQIAYILGISEETVKNHVTAILRKLNANDRTHAVALAINNGWIPVKEKPADINPQQLTTR